MNYLEGLAQRIRAKIPSDDLPDEDIEELLLAYAVLAEAKGSAVSNEDVHNAWVAWMSTINPKHESLVPYSDLDAHTRDEDTVFTKAIRDVAAEEGM